jgi:hydroxypyruvate reductase
MASAVESHWPAGKPLEGLVITRYGHGLPTKRIRVVEAGHPVPDEHGESAAREILASAAALGEDDLLLVLVSGGGSSLLALPVPSVSDGGPEGGDAAAPCQRRAPIQEMNTVRKHLSAIQGGRLAAATRARGAGARHLGRHGRRPHAHRLRAVRTRSLHVCGCPRHPAPAWRAGALFRRRPPRRRCRRKGP